MKLALVLCIFGVSTILATDPPQGKKCMENYEIVEKVLTGYNKMQEPERTVPVTVAMWLQDIEHVDHKKRVASISMYLTSKWDDPRLQFDKLNPCYPNISLAREQVDKIWHPRMAVIDCRTFSLYETPEMNSFTMMFENGTVWVAARAKMEIMCSFEGKEKATCSLMEESFAGNDDKIKLNWDPTPFTSFADEAKTTWKFEKYTAERHTPLYPAGVWNQLKLILEFSKMPNEEKK